MTVAQVIISMQEVKPTHLKVPRSRSEAAAARSGALTCLGATWLTRLQVVSSGLSEYDQIKK